MQNRMWPNIWVIYEHFKGSIPADRTCHHTMWKLFNTIKPQYHEELYKRALTDYEETGDFVNVNSWLRSLTIPSGQLNPYNSTAATSNSMDSNAVPVAETPPLEEIAVLQSSKKQTE